MAQDSVSAEWDAMAGEWDDLAVGYRDGFERILWEQTNLTPDGLVVMDFGCGTGLLTQVLQKKVSQVICIDAAPLMMGQLYEKMKSRGWTNVEAYCVTLAGLDKADKSIQESLDKWKGKVDLIVASSVLSFIPEDDLPTTMKILASFLRQGGILCHSDWPKSEAHPEGFTQERAMEVYQMAGLEAQATNTVSIDMGDGEGHPVYVGVAVKR